MSNWFEMRCYIAACTRCGALCGDGGDYLPHHSSPGEAVCYATDEEDWPLVDGKLFCPECAK